MTGQTTPFTIRSAEESDLDALSELEITAREHEPSWTFRFSYAKQYAEDHRKFNRAKYETLINPRSGFQIILAEDKATGQPVGVSIWQLFWTPWWDAATGSSQEDTMKAAFSDVERRDEHKLRAKAMYAIHDAALEWFFSPHFHINKHLYLGILAVHPDHQGRGVGTELVKWGLRQVEAYPGCKVTLMSSKADGPRMYETNLGFRSLGAVVCSAPPQDDPERVEFRLEMLVSP